MNESARHLETLVEANFDDKQRKALADFEAAIAKDGLKHLEVFFASLPRRFSRRTLERAGLFEGVLDFRSWRHCDLAAARLLKGRPTSEIEKLHAQGDGEEHRMILKVLPLLPENDLAPRLLEAAHRQNDEEVFKAAYADSHLPARCLDDEAYARSLLKAAFLDIPLARLFDARTRARPELSAMLQDFMTEREAAGRKIWPGSLELAAHAPTAGTRARILGDLWHGEDLRRFHAVRGAGILLARADDADLRAELELRRERERAPYVQEALVRVLES